MDRKEKKHDERPQSYPHPSSADEQLKNQPEFLDQEPNRFKKEISDIKTEDPSLKKDDEE